MERGATAAPTYRPARKKEKLDESPPGFNVEADRFEDGADMEIVTKPFEEDDDGIAEFDTAMRQILALYGKLDAAAGQHTRIR